MTIKVTRVRLNRRGMRDLLTREETQQMLAGKAEAVAAAVQAAGIRVEGTPGGVALPVTVVTSAGESRARSRVILDHPSGLAVEAKHGVLTANIDVARAV